MTTKTTAEEPEQTVVRPFAAFLQEQSGGQLHDELSEKLHGLIEAIKETGKGGSISLKIDIKPIAGTDGRTLTVTDSVAAKLPKTERPKSIFFATDDGNLSRSDPRQPVITGLRELDTPATKTQLRSAN
ncbi:hypothetical protein GCM10011583_11500 [Streptomyces camponoticapitis]|uniref:Uncharacterized protein n=1 Tax=Streptomyces camponoticapitis TaxID=1616125 RepID=A0ABQ2E1Z3_9ACTN|nr:hypothetical protein [Streptomyces camponoticapitis]GGJ81750.1 hypothetical protein GCM10011583_11500 [Streptomyces camponoticapitis]